MNTPSGKPAELQNLLQRLSDDSLSPEDARRLNDLLHGDPETCEQYLDHLTLEAHLRHEFGGQQPAREALPAFARMRQARANPTARLWRFLDARVLRFAAAAVLGALFMLGSVLGLRRLNDVPALQREQTEAAHPSTGEGVATLLFADNCEWGKRSRLVEGQRLSAGPLRLERGLVVLRFDGGAAVVLEGPTELAVESRVSARLASGRLTVRAPAEAAGFTVHTPASEVVDLGTEFAVVVERGGATELHVLEGEIAYSKPGSPQEMADLLRAGKAVRYNRAAEETPRAVPLNAPRFTELLRQARIGPREDLLLVYEGFNYPVGPLPLEKADGGIGWAGPWRPSPGGKSSAQDETVLPIGFAKLNVTWPVEGGRGPMLEAPPDYQSRVRTLAQPICLDEDGVYYVSVLVRWEPPPPEVPTNRLPAARLVLRAAKDFNGDHVMFNLPISQRPQIDMRSGATFTSPQTVQQNETQLWVGKIVARRQGEDEVFFRVYGEGEPLDPIEPAAWNVRSRGVQSDARLDILLLSKFGGGNCCWDEVRIGKSWRAVVPAASFSDASRKRCNQDASPKRR